MYWAQMLGNVHGGAQATIYDVCTSVLMAAIARPGFWVFLGVSRTLSVTYMSPAPAVVAGSAEGEEEGMEYVIICEVCLA